MKKGFDHNAMEDLNSLLSSYFIDDVRDRNRRCPRRITSVT